MRLRLLFASSSLAAMSCAYLAGAQTNETYTYDALGRLVKVDSVGGANDGVSNSICYDDAGNRISYQVAQSTVPVL